MFYENEKDYIMRIIQEMVRVLFSLILGKQYTQVELPAENKYTISGKDLEDYLAMIDQGQINEAENLLLEHLDYDNPAELEAAILFYKYISEQSDDFLKAHAYSLEEAADGLKQLAKHAGYGSFILEEY